MAPSVAAAAVRGVAPRPPTGYASTRRAIPPLPDVSVACLALLLLGLLGDDLSPTHLGLPGVRAQKNMVGTSEGDDAVVDFGTDVEGTCAALLNVSAATVTLPAPDPSARDLSVAVDGGAPPAPPVLPGFERCFLGIWYQINNDT